MTTTLCCRAAALLSSLVSVAVVRLSSPLRSQAVPGVKIFLGGTIGESGALQVVVRVGLARALFWFVCLYLFPRPVQWGVCCCVSRLLFSSPTPAVR